MCHSRRIRFFITTLLPWKSSRWAVTEKEKLVILGVLFCSVMSSPYFFSCLLFFFCCLNVCPFSHSFPHSEQKAPSTSAASELREPPAQQEEHQLKTTSATTAGTSMLNELMHHCSMILCFFSAIFSRGNVVATLSCILDVGLYRFSKSLLPLML